MWGLEKLCCSEPGGSGWFPVPKDLSSSNSLAPGAPTLHVGQTAQGCEHFIGSPKDFLSKKIRGPMGANFKTKIS